MGEVYRAEDSKLGREVAIKVLPEAVATDPERLARFQREAQVLASLNHPNISAIYQVEQDGDTHFLVMELAEGEDLSARLERGPIPVDEALPIALRIVEALEAAHEKGVIHRDLKPANVKVTAEGAVKVLDFGLAKALAPEGHSPDGASLSDIDPSLSPTLTAQMTGLGVILGTASYMSPEQARGNPVDKRADIWAFGCVLAEMLTGRRGFAGETVSDTLAAVLTSEIDLGELPATVPTSVRALIRRCQVKDHDNRLRDIGEARLALVAAIADEKPGEEPGDEPGFADPGGDHQRSKRSLGLLIAGAAVGLLLGAVVTWLGRPSTPAKVIKLQVPTDHLRAERVRGPLISPNGKMVLIPEGGALSLRHLDKLSARRIPDSYGARFPTWSTDSQSVGFIVGSEIRKVSVQGGSPTPVARLTADVAGSGGMAWTASDHFLVAGGDKTGLLEVSAQGGELKEILALGEGQDVDFHEISLLPNGRDAVFVVHRTSSDSEVRIVDSLAVFVDGERKDVFRFEGEAIESVVYSPPGYLVFHRSSTTPGIWALPFSLSKLEATGEPFLVAAASWLPSTSADGTLLFVHGLELPHNELVQVDRQGNLIKTIDQFQGIGEAPHLSPDGTKLAIGGVEDSNFDIRIHDLERGSSSRFTFETTFENGARWSPQGDELLFASADVRQVKIKPVGSSGEARVVGEGLIPDWMPDGSGFVFMEFSDETDSWDISYKFFEADKATRFLSTEANEQGPRLSPNGKHLLYISDESESLEVFVRPFPSGEGKWQVSTAGGADPHWSRDGDEIFYLEGDDLMAVEVLDGDSFALGSPQLLMASTSAVSMFAAGESGTFAPGIDGQSFFLVRPVVSGSPNQLMLIQNWHAEFGEHR